MRLLTNTPNIFNYFKLQLYIISYHLKLKKMCAELANLNHCTVPFQATPKSTCAATMHTNIEVVEIRRISETGPAII